MYSIQTTPGFIIDSRPTGEAGKMLSVFTRDLGLVRAVAQGIRLEKSKLRYHARDYSFGIFSFVRGKEYWRMTSANEITEGKGKKEEGKELELIIRVAILLRRLLHGEEPHPGLFDDLNECYKFIEESREIDEEEMKTLESLIVMRILNWLGYIGNDPELSVCFETREISEELLENCARMRTTMNKHINKALKESQL